MNSSCSARKSISLTRNPIRPFMTKKKSSRRIETLRCTNLHFPTNPSTRSIQINTMARRRIRLSIESLRPDASLFSIVWVDHSGWALLSLMDTRYFYLGNRIFLSFGIVDLPTEGLTTYILSVVKRRAESGRKQIRDRVLNPVGVVIKYRDLIQKVLGSCYWTYQRELDQDRSVEMWWEDMPWLSTNTHPSRSHRSLDHQSRSANLTSPDHESYHTKDFKTSSIDD